MTGCCEVLLLLFWIFFISVIFLLRVTYIILSQSCVKYKKEVGTGSKWRNKGGEQSAEGLKERDRKQTRRQGSSRGMGHAQWLAKAFSGSVFICMLTHSPKHIYFSLSASFLG